MHVKTVFIERGCITNIHTLLHAHRIPGEPRMTPPPSRHFLRFGTKVVCFTRVLADGLGWGSVEGVGGGKPPPLVSGLTTHDKVGGFSNVSMLLEPKCSAGVYACKVCWQCRHVCKCLLEMLACWHVCM